jgi:hypothetical protein
MYLSYFVTQQFPFPQGASAGPFTRFPGVPGLGFYRPNQALNRVYTTRAALNGLGRGLGQLDTSDPTTLLVLGGAGLALAFAMGIFGKRKFTGYNKKRKRRKVRRLQAKIASLQA